MWHENRHAEVHWKGLELTRLKQTGEGSTGLRGKLRRSKYQVKHRAAVTARRSLVSPKQSSNPTPPGCCSAFCTSEGISPRISHYQLSSRTDFARARPGDDPVHLQQLAYPLAEINA